MPRIDVSVSRLAPNPNARRPLDSPSQSDSASRYACADFAAPRADSSLSVKHQTRASCFSTSISSPCGRRASPICFAARGEVASMTKHQSRMPGFSLDLRSGAGALDQFNAVLVRVADEADERAAFAEAVRLTLRLDSLARRAPRASPPCRRPRARCGRSRCRARTCGRRGCTSARAPTCCRRSTKK